MRVLRRGVPVLVEMKPVSPRVADGALLTVEIIADGKALDGHLQVFGVDVWSAVNAVPNAKVVLLAGTPPDEPFPPKDFEALQPGKPIEIRAGYDATPTAIFSGVVVAHGIELAGDGTARVVVDAAGHAVTMTDSGRRRCSRL
jgi:phage protein D